MNSKARDETFGKITAADLIPDSDTWMTTARQLFLQRGYVHLLRSQVQIDLLRLEHECAELVRLAGNKVSGSKNNTAGLDEGLVVVTEAGNPQQLCRMEYLAGISSYIKTQLVRKLATLIEPLILQPVNLFKDKCNFKHAGGGAFPAHQDITAYRHFNTRYQVTAAVMLDQAVLKNGALEMASHWDVGTPSEATPRGNLPLLPSHVGGHRNGDILDELSKEMVWEIIEAAPGDVLVFDSYVPHRSQANQSSNTRRILFFTFNPASEGDLYYEYYRAKWKAPNDPIFHVSTPTVHDATV